MYFTGAYSVHPLCIGFYFALLTGKYPARIEKSKQYGLCHPMKRPWPKLLKEQGFSTFFANKWYLSKQGAYS